MRPFLPGDAHRVVQSVFVEHAEQLGRGAREPDQTERGQHRVPQHEQTLEPEPGAVSHQPPQTEHQSGVRGAVVEPAGPVIDHPLARRLVVEVLLEVEHVRIVGRLRIDEEANHGCRAVYKNENRREKYDTTYLFFFLNCVLTGRRQTETDATRIFVRKKKKKTSVLTVLYFGGRYNVTRAHARVLGRAI